MKNAHGRVSPAAALRLARQAGRALGQHSISCIEWAVSSRPLMIGFLLVCAALSVAGWIRPPMSHDLSAAQLPLFAQHDPPLSIESHFAAPGRFGGCSIAMLLAPVVLFGIGLVTVQPRRFPTVCGVLLGVSLAANAAAAWNHPALIESLEFELDAAGRVRKALLLHDERTLARQAIYSRNLNSAEDLHRADLVTGFKYLQYGVWLSALAAFGAFLGSRGPGLQRLGYVTRWAAVSVPLIAVVCGARLRAEWHWQRACAAELRGDFAAARTAAERAVASFPAFHNLHRTWFLVGQLDYRDGEWSDARQYFHVYQLASADHRQQALHECLKDTSLLQMSSVSPPTRLVCRLLCEQALADYEDGRHSAAETAWRRLPGGTAGQLDVPMLMALGQLATDHLQPEETAALIDPLLDRLRDRALKAELWSTLGDLHFSRGQYADARDCYRRSLREFHLPKVINHRALKGLIGI